METLLLAPATQHQQTHAAVTNIHPIQSDPRPPVNPSPSPSAGVYTFGLFTVDIFVNAGQVVTGNLAPYFLTVCKPNYTALGCQQSLRYISHQEACTGNQDDILRARKTFPSKEAALSVYAALYLAVSCLHLNVHCVFTHCCVLL